MSSDPGGTSSGGDSRAALVREIEDRLSPWLPNGSRRQVALWPTDPNVPGEAVGPSASVPPDYIYLGFGVADDARTGFYVQGGLRTLSPDGGSVGTPRTAWRDCPLNIRDRSFRLIPKLLEDIACSATEQANIARQEANRVEAMLKSESDYGRGRSD